MEIPSKPGHDQYCTFSNQETLMAPLAEDHIEGTLLHNAQKTWLGAMEDIDVFTQNSNAFKFDSERILTPTRIQDYCIEASKRKACQPSNMYNCT